MTGTLETFEGLAEETTLAVSIPGSTQQRWTWRGGRMVNADGHAVEPWFFSGALREGKVVLADFRPPVVGEWFSHRTDSRYLYLVLNTAGEKRDHPDVAAFRDGRWYSFTDVRQIVDVCRRCEAPEWSSPVLVSMTELAWTNVQEVVRQRHQTRRTDSARAHLRRAREYLTNSLDLLEERT